jgi:putative FmdB family regulatory protein
MPIYDYECAEHGTFEMARPMSQSGNAGVCPDCGSASNRIITAPRLRTLGPLTRMSMERNEKSRHSPHVCTSGCSHKAAPAAQNTDRSGKPKLISYRGPRPWVVEHK